MTSLQSKLTRYAPQALAILYFAAFLPFLAHAPQSGDAAELVSTAVQGGLNHPPGFPLQSWLDRLFVLLPVSTPAFRLSLLSHLAQSASVGLFVSAALSFGAGLFGAVVAALGYAFYAPVLREGIQPEVFALSNLLVILQFWLLSRAFLGLQVRAPGRAVLLGTAFALPFIQQPIAVCSFFAILACATLVLDKKSALVAFGSFVSVVVAGYCSLFFLQGGAAWPNWGSLSSGSDVLRHALRLEYGIFNLHVAASGPGIHLDGISALVAVFRASPGYLAFAPFLVAGLSVLIERLASHQLRDRLVALGILGSCVAGFALIERCGVTVVENSELVRNMGLVVLERFQAPFIIPICLVVAMGVDASCALFSNPRLRTVFLGTLCLIFALLVPKSSMMEAGVDGTADVYRDSYALDVPREAIFLGSDDWEILYGFRQDGLQIHFPIAGRLLNLPWYRDHTLAALDPRLSWRGDGSPSISQLVDIAYAKGIPVVSSEPSVFKNHPGSFELRGLVFVLHSSIHSSHGHSLRTLEDASRLCGEISRLDAIPASGIFSGHEFTRVLRERMVRAYFSASLAAHEDKNPYAEAAAVGVVYALERGTSPHAWTDNCTRLQSALRFQTAP